MQENFGEFAFFLHDIYGGDFIAVVWKKSAFTPKEFTVRNPLIKCRTKVEILNSLKKKKSCYNLILNTDEKFLVTFLFYK